MCSWVDSIKQRKVPHIDKGFEEIKAAKSGQDSTRESMEEGVIDKESTNSHAVSSYPEPSIIEKNRIPNTVEDQNGQKKNKSKITKLCQKSNS